ALSFSPDSRRLVVSSSGDGQSVVFDVATGQKVFTLRGDHGVFSGDGKLLFSADLYGNPPRVRVWDAVTGQPGATWSLKHGAGLFRVRPGGSPCALVDRASPRVVRIHDPWTGKEKATVDKRSEDHLALSPDGKILAIAGRDGVTLWDVATGKETRRWQ